MASKKCEELQRSLESSKQETKAKGGELKCFQSELRASQNKASNLEQQLRFWNYWTGKKQTVERSNHGLQLLPQESVVIAEHVRGNKKLGEGSYAKVYVGKYLGKDRAVKVFKEDLFSSDKVKEEFERLNSLKHPNIVRVYGMWEDPHKGKNSLAIVMELCDGSLLQFIEQSTYKGISSEQKLKILHDITCAMVYLHSQNVVHGDLRTPNVLVNKSNDVVTAKLTDFGRARLLKASANAHYTASPIDDDYLPPEVYNHDEYKNEPKNYARLTRQVDAFFFGPITIELTCGQFPKPGPKIEKKKGTVVKTFSEVERREKHLMMIKPGDRMYVDLIVEQCMADNPADRASFEELQLIVEVFQKKYDKRPDKEMLEEKQREVESLKSAMEADQVTLNYEVQLEEIEKECERFKEEAKLKSEQLAAAEESLRKKDEEYRVLQELHGKHEAASVSDISRLKEMTLDQKKRLKTLQDELTTKMDLGDRLESLELKLRLKEEELTQLRATIVQNELAQKKLEDDGLKHEKLKSTHECLKGKHNNVEGHIKYLEEKSKKDHEECFSLARELKEAKDKVKEVESLSQQTKVANEKMAAELKEKVKLLEKALHQLEEESKTLEREHMCQLLRRDEEIGQLTAYSTSLKEVHRELQSEFESLKTKSGKTELEVKAVEKQLQSTLQRAETLQKQLNRDLQQRSRDIAQLNNNVQHYIDKFSALQITFQDRQNEVSKLKIKNKELEEQVRTLKDNLGKEFSRAKKAEDSFSTSKTSEKQLSKQLTDLRISRGALQVQFNSTTTERDNLEQTKTALEGQVEKLERQVKALRMDFDLQKVVALDNMDKLHQTRVAKESMTAELKENVEQLERVNQQLEEVKKTLEALKSDYEKKLESLDLKLCNRDKEVDQFKVTIGQKEAKIQAAQEVLSDPSDKYSSASERDEVIQTADMPQSLDHHFQKMTQSLGQMFRDSVAKWPPGGAEVVPAQQWSLPGPAVAFQDLSLLQSSQQKSLPSSSLPLAINTKSYASTAGQSTGSPSLLESVDPSLLQQTLTVQKLMPYIPDLADKGLRIAGHLNMHKQWDSLASSQPELCDRLQKLFAMWLEGEEDSETPHTWGFFISLVQEKGIDQHRLARKICSNLNKAPAPNGASLSSSSHYLQ